ncbi:CHRD domain-containing protein [Halegenticoccus tardaugens]|uniref:CHRD domain-containing protein n=1 Tax=Halegenticoccus tardaugens TaxID=2071624 RepID=UPI00100AB833|nr:CHRD domain-containing protein [Halegenticoccus tardaugens]
MIDRQKRSTLQVIGTSAAALAGLTAGTTATNTATVQSDDEQSFQLPGDLLSTGLLEGDNEVPPVDSDGEGIAAFQASPDRTRLGYALLAINANAPITAAHIHLGEKGENGPVVVHLLGDQADAEQSIVENNAGAVGTITNDDLVGPLEGGSIEDLLDEIHAKNAYVNVHTTEATGGELRDQIYAAEELEVEIETEIEAVSNSPTEITVEIELDVDLERAETDKGKNRDKDDNGDNC